MASSQRLSAAKLRMRIAETRVRQWRVAQALGISEVHLSHILVERKPADEAMLERIAEAIEAVAGEAVA